VRPTITSAVVGLLAAAMMAASQTTAAATAGGGDAAGTRASTGAVRALVAKDSPTGHRPSASAVAAIARYKARHDTQAALVRAAAAASAARNAQKMALLKNAPPRAVGSPRAVYSGSGYAAISPLNQQGQQTSYWCGPAVVSEMAITVPGPSYVDQPTAASYMGTNSSSGTSISAMVNGLNNYVGVPDFGWNYYAFVPVDYTPTDAQRSAFLADVQYDTGRNSPVAGDAWEVPGGPHLVGHPANQQIFHYFEIGGWNTNSSQIYYADSATTVWSSVPAYSWLDTYTLVTIIGGRGYIW
jgi:hypothetical protein